MRNKYYTPDIEEFYVGFEYEELVSMKGGSAVPEKEHHETWKKVVATKSHLIIGFSEWPWITRVKYLDKRDLEDLGFIEEPCGSYFEKGEYQLYRDIHPIHNITIYADYPRTIFQGTIKNKSELKQILKMLGI